MFKQLTSIALLAVATVALTACVNFNSAERQNQMEAESYAEGQIIAERFDKCRSSAPIGTKAQCAVTFYNDIQRMKYTDYTQVAALKFATSMYELHLKLDRRQINNGDYQAGWMRVINDFEIDLANLRKQNRQEILELARYRQQYFIDLARLFNPPRNNISCVSVKQGFVTTTDCN